MSKTYRALAIVAVVVTAVSLVATFTFDPVRVGGWFSYAPLSPGARLQALLNGAATGAWTTTMALAPAVVGTFGAVVAAQGRHWVWLGVFIALGLLGLYGDTTLYLLAIYLSPALSLNPLAVASLTTVTLQALPAIAALLFVATTSRSARMHSDQASEAAA